MKTKILHNTFFLFMLNCSYFHKTRHCLFSFHWNTENSIVACGVENDNSLFEWVLNNILWFQRADKHDLAKSFLFIFNWDRIILFKYFILFYIQLWILSKFILFLAFYFKFFLIHPFCFLCFLLLCHGVFHVDFKNKLVRLYKILFFIILYVYFKDLAN